jgi:ribosomal protein S18 acetylase RimI-like enzyme
MVFHKKNKGGALTESMAQDFALREADFQELSEVEALVKTAYQEFRPHFPETAWSAWMDNIGKTVFSGTGVVLVIASSGKIHGAVKFYPDAGQAGLGYWPPGTASMRILAVHPDSRGRGYGRLLVQDCIARAQALQVAAIYLYTGSFMQAARQLYESLGFRRAPQYDKEPGPIAYRLDL